MLRKATNASRKLAELRDYLLPKLLSGQVRVEHAERDVQEVAGASGSVS